MEYILSICVILSYYLGRKDQRDQTRKEECKEAVERQSEAVANIRRRQEDFLK